MASKRETPQQAWQRMTGGLGSATQAPRPSAPVARTAETARPAPPATTGRPRQEPPPPEWQRESQPQPQPQPQPSPQPSSGPSEPSTGELVKQLSEQVTTLVQKELRLAQVEMTQKGKQAGIGVGLFGGGGVLALYGLWALVAAIILLLAKAVDGWIAALIVAVVLFAAAGVLALIGKKHVEQATPPAPAAAIGSVQRDIAEVKGRARR